MRILSVLSASHETNRNATTHGVSLLTWISDAGSTPAASTNFRPLQEGNRKIPSGCSLAAVRESAMALKMSFVLKNPVDDPVHALGFEESKSM